MVKAQRMKYLFLLLSFIFLNHAFCFELKGIMVDAADKTPLPYANVYLKNQLRGTITNADGFFALQFSSSQFDSVVFGYLGYETEVISTDSFSKNGINTVIIHLVKKAVKLPEIIISPAFAIHLVRKAIFAIPFNYSTNSIYRNAFYRESIFSGIDSNYEVNEAIIVSYNSSIHTDINKDQVYLSKGRTMSNIDSSNNSYRISILGGPFSGQNIDPIRNNANFIQLAKLSQFNYYYLGTTVYNNLECYWVSFEKKNAAGYRGELIIDKNSLAFVKIKANYSASKPNSNSLLGFQLKEKEIIIDYKLINNKWELSYLSNASKIDLKHSNGNSNQIKILMHYLVTSEATKEDIATLKPLNRNWSLPTQKGQYDSQFWKNYQIILPEKSWITAIND